VFTASCLPRVEYSAASELSYSVSFLDL
jgi:hypothetical protein